ncbi:MAG: saccharopine dehydrogenase NADP-binding domain-containing protein [Spirochaetales bacterium]|uniref:Saccharopine dehydrogenase NADP-binding domain-containing protein n=1 Tax=Candidatus Thalassospirochaeta sargassi TaxID=3119039 RepID=A0AAJ1MJ57_9SPIO|nr:saccharopine dehydrogenase NADP-binding domain-containing protein [Spirochaetales bacterium]
MKVLLVGSGGVGTAIASIASKNDSNGEWLEQMVVCDYNKVRAEEVAAGLNDRRFTAEQIDAGNKTEIKALADKYGVDFIMNACDPVFNMSIFEAAYECGCTYMDMAMSLSVRDEKDPYGTIALKLGDLQYAKDEDWKKKNLLAVCGSGVEPGMVNVFARYADDKLFDEIHELNVRDADNLVVEGLDVAFGFSIWTTIEECLNPPVIWEKDKGWFVTESFSEPEIFRFPEPVGDQEVINVEHEEVLMLPRYFKDKGLKRATFKFGVDRDMRRVLKTLEALGLDKTEKVNVKGVEVSPRDVVAACSPDPALIGDRMKGQLSAGLWVKGLKDGKERSVYIYQLVDNEECMKLYGSQAIVAQTAFNPVIMMELIAKGIWTGTGVNGPENFPAEPFMQRMEGYNFPAGMMEMESEYKNALDEENLKAGF